MIIPNNRTSRHICDFHVGLLQFLDRSLKTGPERCCSRSNIPWPERPGSILPQKSYRTTEPHHPRTTLHSQNLQSGGVRAFSYPAPVPWNHSLGLDLRTFWQEFIVKTQCRLEPALNEFQSSPPRLLREISLSPIEFVLFHHTYVAANVLIKYK